MRITVRQLKKLIREAVEDASTQPQQLFDSSLGLEDITTSREKSNGTVSLFDPETEDTYKITIPSRYVRLYKPDWEIKSYRNQPLLVAGPKDAHSTAEVTDADFIAYANGRISQYVNKRRASYKARKQEFFQRKNELQYDYDFQIALKRRNAKRINDLTPEEKALELDNFAMSQPSSLDYSTHEQKFVDYWKNK